MANPLLGEVAFPPVDVPGFEKGGTIVLSFNELCELEAALGRDIERIGAESLQSPTMMRTVFRIAMGEHHDAVDDRTAGRIIQALGVDSAAQMVLEAFQLSFPEASRDGEADPRKGGAAGTGSPSSKRGASSASRPRPSGGRRRG